LRRLLGMTKHVFQRDNMHYAYGTELKDMQSYMKLKIPAVRNVTKTRLGVSQPTQKLPLTKSHDKLFPSFMFLFSHKTSMCDRPGHRHLKAYLGISMSVQDSNIISAINDNAGRCHKRISARATAWLRINILCYIEII
jgi:hypothetical protein